VPLGFGLHYLVADRGGDVAVIEFLDGRTVVHRGADLPAPVLANDTYATSLRYLQRHAGFGGERRETGGPESPERFVRAARGVAAYGVEPSVEDPVDAAFAILDDVRQDDTQWALVHDARRTILHLRVRGREDIRTVALADLDLRSGQPRCVMAVTDALDGVPTDRWIEWTPAIELQLRACVSDLVPAGFPGAHPRER